MCYIIATTPLQLVALCRAVASFAFRRFCSISCFSEAPVMAIREDYCGIQQWRAVQEAQSTQFQLPLLPGKSHCPISALEKNVSQVANDHGLLLSHSWTKMN
ncbi:hypothetical protein HD806DRAFT_493332 [Xylariaceae sp. AK1471]|nr:hypothetical protein HD806DRAFT_493332 [Xylariaceae sp. AK1471]